MKKLILKILSILAAFFLGILFMSYFMSIGNRDFKDAMSAPRFRLFIWNRTGAFST